MVTARIGGVETTFGVQHLLMATGRRPNTDGLGLDTVEVCDCGEVVVEEFVVQQSMVHDWADDLASQQILTTRQPPQADRFCSPRETDRAQARVS